MMNSVVFDPRTTVVVVQDVSCGAENNRRVFLNPSIEGFDLWIATTLMPPHLTKLYIVCPDGHMEQIGTILPCIENVVSAGNISAGNSQGARVVTYNIFQSSPAWDDAIRSRCGKYVLSDDDLLRYPEMDIWRVGSVADASRLNREDRRRQIMDGMDPEAATRRMLDAIRRRMEEIGKPRREDHDWLPPDE